MLILYQCPIEDLAGYLHAEEIWNGHWGGHRGIDPSLRHILRCIRTILSVLSIPYKERSIILWWQIRVKLMHRLCWSGIPWIRWGISPIWPSNLRRDGIRFRFGFVSLLSLFFPSFFLSFVYTSICLYFTFFCFLIRWPYRWEVRIKQAKMEYMKYIYIFFLSSKLKVNFSFIYERNSGQSVYLYVFPVSVTGWVVFFQVFCFRCNFRHKNTAVCPFDDL